MTTRCEFRAFDEFTLRELYDVMHLRDVVFVVGQKITAVSEVDGEDPQCHHALFYLDDRLIGTLRVFSDETPLIVGRVAIHTDFQGRGYGRQLMEHLHVWLDGRRAELHAQAHLEGWYASLGWERFGEVFQEAEIPHVMMRFN